MPPTGTVTLLFTDVEGSTKLLERLGDGFADAIAEHHWFVRAALDRHGGYEVDTAGDGFFATFSRPRDAVACALDIQRDLEDWPACVRIGIHTGTPEWRDEKYVGMDVHRAARVMAAAHGGQVLLTGATATLLGDGLVLRDVGEHRLKDLPAPERLWQAGDGEFPPPRSLNLSRLPVAPTALVGRDDEVRASVETLRSGTRLLTLTGTGGSGKTRLALAVATEAASAFSDGAVFVDLAPVREAGGVAAAITAAVPGGGTDLASRVRDRRMLLVLDNFEHVMDAAPLVAEVLASEPGLAALVTSRIPLRLRGEVERHVEPLEPVQAQELFAARVRDAGIEIDERDPAVAEICRLLDGLPLALELAAARLPLFGAPALAARLAHRLDVLSDGARDAPERQRTLRATVEWSHRLLDAGAQAVFRRLAVFSGGATLDAAEAVCGPEALDGIARLLQASLVRRVADPLDEPRVAMLETLREFAIERLAADDDADAAADRHAAYFVELGERIAPQLFTSEHPRMRGRLAADIDNVRGAHDRLLETEPEAALRLIASCWAYFDVVGPLSEGTRRLQASLRTATGDPATRGLALFGAVRMSAEQGDLDAAEAAAAEGLSLLRDAGEPRLLAIILSYSASVARLRRDAGRARALHEEALAVARSTGAEWWIGMALNNMADDLMSEDPERAEALFREALEARTKVGEPRGILLARGNLAELALAAGRLAETRSHAAVALQHAEALGDEHFGTWLTTLVAYATCLEGDAAAALATAAQAAEKQSRVGDVRNLSALLVLAARLAAGVEPVLAARALGAADALDSPGLAHEDRVRADAAEIIEAALGRETSAQERGAGAVQPPRDVLEAALAASDSR